MIRLRNISVHYGTDVIFEKADFDFAFGQVTALVGESGCGKTSLLNILAFQNKDNYFEYELPVNMSKTQFVRNELSYLKQNVEFIDYLNCKDNIQFYCKLAGIELTNNKIEEVLNMVGLINEKESLPTQLSGGQKQRLAIAMAIAKESKFIILDEITSALDRENIDQIMLLLKNMASQGKCIVIACHDDYVYEQCDVIYRFSNQQVEKMVFNESTIQESDLFLINRSYSLNKKDLFGVIKKRYFSLWKNYFVFSILIALIIGVSSVGFLLSRQYTGVINESIKKATTNQSYIVKREVDENMSGYNLVSVGFDESVLPEVNKVNGVIKTYPFYSFNLQEGMNDYDNFSEQKPIYIEEVYSDVLQVKWEHNREEKFFSIENMADVLVYPSFKELDLTASTHLLNTGIDEGVYISYNLAYSLGIDSLEGNPKISVLCGIPVGQKISGEYRNLLYKMQRLTFSVKGVLEESYPVVSGLNIIFYDNQKMDQILNENINSVTLPVGFSPYQYNAYTVFTENRKSIENIQAILEPTDAYLKDVRLSLEYKLNPYLMTKQFLNQYTTIITIMCVMSSIAYSFYYYHQNKRSHQILKNWALSYKEDYTMIKYDYFISLCLTSILSLFSFMAFYYVAKYLNYFMPFPLKGEMIITTIFYFLILCVSSNLFVQIYSIMKVRR